MVRLTRNWTHTGLPSERDIRGMKNCPLGDEDNAGEE
jgi:hypothetical protein